MIKYIGSKRVLIPYIEKLARYCQERFYPNVVVPTALDMFAGTTRVGQALRKLNYLVFSNDLSSYSYAFGYTYLYTLLSDGCHTEEALRNYQYFVDTINNLEPIDGFITETYCRKSRYFQPANGMKIDAALKYIREYRNHPDTSVFITEILRTALIEAADRVDSTVGLQMAYLKEWSPRSYNPLQLRVPEFISGPRGNPIQLDANFVAHSYHKYKIKFDFIYLDPPYNQHSYYGNYHIWETLCQDDNPEVYGIACKRVDNKVTKSRYNSKRTYADTFYELVNNLDSTVFLVSFSNEGFITSAEISDILAMKGHVHRIDVEHNRYIGSKIGIYNPVGNKVGIEAHNRNIEHLFLVTPEVMSTVELGKVIE